MRIEGLSITTYYLAQTLFLMGVFLKQFYLFSSGGLQIGDLCFLACFFILVVFVNHCRLWLLNRDELIVAFVGCVTVINSIYIMMYENAYLGEFRFHKSIIYYIYILFIILTFRELCSDLEFLRRMSLVLKASLVLQLGIYLFGLGRSDTVRYMGTFNDPNQCAFFIMSSFLLIYIISQIIEDKPVFIVVWYALSFYLIMKTVSTGMLLGMSVFAIAYLFDKISKRDLNSALLFVLVIGIVLFTIILFYIGIIHLPKSITDTGMYSRVISKLWRFGFGVGSAGSGGLRNILIDRCWDRLADYPTRILYGAGEGYFGRFPSAKYTSNEIHSSILGPLFYYGIIPCSIWFVWTGSQLKGIKRELWAAYIALIIESITLVNNRQPFFWMIFVLAGSILAKNSDAGDVRYQAV